MTETKKNISTIKQSNIFSKAIEAYKKYEPRDPKDKEQHKNNLDNLMDVMNNVYLGINEIGLHGEIVAEMPIKHKFKELKLDVTGQADLIGLDKHDNKCLIEIKTKWRKRTGKYKSDGTPSFSIVQPKPFDDYYLQTNFYALATKLKPYLLIANENEYNIYTEENCNELKKENRDKYINRIIRTCRRRERLAERHQGKQTWTQDIEPNFSHFTWDQDHIIIGEELWNTNI